MSIYKFLDSQESIFEKPIQQVKLDFQYQNYVYIQYIQLTHIKPLSRSMEAVTNPTSAPTNNQEKGNVVASPTQPEVSLEEVSKQELIKLVKEKIKQNKTLVGKNSKLQTKYINVYKEHKLYKKDHETFLAFLNNVFKENISVEVANNNNNNASTTPGIKNTQIKQLGTFDLPELEQKWAARESQFNEKLRQLMQEVGKEKEHIEKSFKKQLQQQLGKADSNTKASLQILQGRIKQLQDTNRKLSEELVKAEAQLLDSRSQFKKIQQEKLKIEHELNDIRIVSVKSELESSMNAFNADIRGGREEFDRTELLLLRQELDEVKDQNEELKKINNQQEDKLRAKNKQIELLKHQIQQLSRASATSTAMSSSTAEKRIQAPSPVLKDSTSNKNGSVNKANSEEGRNGKSSSIQENSKQTVSFKQQNSKQPGLQKEYLKNVFSRYMKCLSESDNVQAQILENVLMTILEFSSSQREVTAVRRKAWWSFFK